MIEVVVLRERKKAIDIDGALNDLLAKAIVIISHAVCAFETEPVYLMQALGQFKPLHNLFGAAI
ncbi:hypothetical protein [Prosthecomicrobium sp. N25]|uniref:hypothetical protein n=1 Tax=Prosthecomicrobium sp. N25 TaxID=3129254 RepID=UPI00307778B2